MTNIVDWGEAVQTKVPCSRAVLLQVVRAAIIDFCEKTRLYTYDVPAINVVASTHSYTITPESNTQVVAVERVAHDGLEIDPASEGYFDSLYDDWRTTGTGIPEGYLLTPDIDSIRLVRTPDAAITGGLAIKIAQAPTRTATVVPDWIFNKYREPIACGALASLYEMKNKDWYDTRLARKNEIRFNSACGVGGLKAHRSSTRAPSRTTPQF